MTKYFLVFSMPTCETPYLVEDFATLNEALAEIKNIHLQGGNIYKLGQEIPFKIEVTTDIKINNN